MKSPRVVFTLLFFVIMTRATAQISDSVYVSNIQTVRLYNSSSQMSFPVLMLNGNQALALNFDDLDADVKYYYYTFQLCNRDWTPANLGQFDYIKGFTQVRITDYRFSSYSQVRYTHYTTTVPDRSMYPTRSGNYILKVFLNGDTSQVVFTKRFLVVDNKTNK